MRTSKRLAIVCMAAALSAGCSMNNPFAAPANASGKPVVWNCASVGISSPSKWACSDGKTYTSFQLRDFRQNALKHGDNTMASK